MEDGRIVGAGYVDDSGGSWARRRCASATKEATFAAPSSSRTCSATPEIDGTSARFVQTVGGRTALPAPRRVNHPPFVQSKAPLVWTTLALILHADGRHEFDSVGASPFPRHWIYDDEGKLTAKAGLADFKEWWRHAFGKHTPWGDEDSPALVTAVETALERELVDARSCAAARSRRSARSRRARCSSSRASSAPSCTCCSTACSAVEVDGEPLAELGPGAILGERAVLEERPPHVDAARASRRCASRSRDADQIDLDAPRAS